MTVLYSALKTVTNVSYYVIATTVPNNNTETVPFVVESDIDPCLPIVWIMSLTFEILHGTFC